MMGIFWSKDTETTTPSNKRTTIIHQTTSMTTNRHGERASGTSISTTTIVNCNIKNQSELSPGTISSIILGICLFLLILGIILKYIRKYLKKKKRKTPKQENDNNAEGLYAEIDSAEVDQDMLAHRMNEHLPIDTGEYNHLYEIQITEQKTRSGETTLVMDSSGYSHVVIKNGGSEPDQTELNQSNTINRNSSEYQQMIKKNGDYENRLLKDVTSGEDHDTKNYINLGNVSSDKSNVGKEEEIAYDVFESVT